MKEWWIVEGVMPERALDRLQKAGICVERAKKIQKKRILFCINKKDCEKAFAIYPNMCYNSKRGSVYSFARVGAKSVRARRIFMARSIGVMLGVCLFSAILAFSSSLVLRLEFLGADVYQREVKEILRAEGVRLYAPYESGKEDVLTAKILALDGVEFCSVQKYGNALRIELRTNVFSSARREEGALVAPVNATVLSAVALSGTLLKKAGESVNAGESLVEDKFVTAEGEYLPVVAVGKVKLLCKETFLGGSIDELTHQALLLAETQGGELIKLEQAEDGSVTAFYTLVVKKNM